jgi:hypothetical protein
MAINAFLQGSSSLYSVRGEGYSFGLGWDHSSPEIHENAIKAERVRNLHCVNEYDE